jgi:hypothetical protein
MNHPEFSNMKNSGFFMIVYAFFLASLENRAGIFFRGEGVFLGKNPLFFPQTNPPRPNRFLQGRFLSEARKSP